MTVRARVNTLRKVTPRQHGPHLQKAHVRVRDGGDLAVHDAGGRTHNLPAKHLADALVAHAHTEERHAGAQLAHRLHRNPRVLRPPCQRKASASVTDWPPLYAQPLGEGHFGAGCKVLYFQFCSKHRGIHRQACRQAAFSEQMLQDTEPGGPGPGETSTPRGFIAAISSTVISSFLYTTCSQPRSPRYCSAWQVGSSA